MPNTGSIDIVSGASTAVYYAIDGAFPTSPTQAELDSKFQHMMYWIKSASIQTDPTDISIASTNYSIHWMHVRDELLPDSNDFIDDALRVKYYTPFSKTINGKANFQRHIVQIAALYCAWRIETRSYPGGGMPNDSQYAITLRTMMNERLNELLAGAVRLKGQRLKANNRFINPHIEEYPAAVKQGMDQTTTPPSSVQTSYRTNLGE